MVYRRIYSYLTFELSLSHFKNKRKDQLLIAIVAGRGRLNVRVAIQTELHEVDRH